MQRTISPGRIGCIGEAMVELTSVSSNADSVGLGFAGDTLNTAIYLKRLLGSASDVAFVTRLGRDTYSARMIDFIHSESIDSSYIERTDKRHVGLYAIDTDASGERTFSYWRDNSAARQLFQSDGDTLNFDSLKNFDVLYLSAITLAILPGAARTALIQELDALRRDGAKVVFDSNYRPALWESREHAQHAVAEAWRITDIALPSIDDEMALFGDANESALRNRLHSYGIVRGALKRGADGPVPLDPASPAAVTLPMPAHVEVIDSTAAGDSFNAGALGNGNGSDAEAMQAGHALALRVIGQRGAIIPSSAW